VVEPDAEPREATTENERVDISGFQLAFNPDVFCGQVPQTEEEKEEWTKDEQEVRAICNHLNTKVMPELVLLDRLKLDLFVLTLVLGSRS
jgi:protein TIF31